MISLVLLVLSFCKSRNIKFKFFFKLDDIFVFVLDVFYKIFLFEIVFFSVGLLFFVEIYMLCNFK